MVDDPIDPLDPTIDWGKVAKKLQGELIRKELLLQEMMNTLDMIDDLVRWMPDQKEAKEVLSHFTKK